MVLTCAPPPAAHPLLALGAFSAAACPPPAFALRHPVARLARAPSAEPSRFPHSQAARNV
eukprot:576863-Prymnesium_polylepis.1